MEILVYINIFIEAILCFSMGTGLAQSIGQIQTTLFKSVLVENLQQPLYDWGFIMKKTFLYFFLVILLLSFNVISYSKSIQKELANNVIRLHVVANSNSEADQKNKLIVRDNVLSYLNSLELDSISNSKKIILDNFENIKSVANTTLSELGCSYRAEIYFNTFRFPAKKYGDITLPSGNYEALKIVLGEGEGKNWWCVMYPPLCFRDLNTGLMPETSKLHLKNSLSNDCYKLITSNEDIELRFKCIDFINSIL
jgi:stage II sporulation protein R